MPKGATISELERLLGKQKHRLKSLQRKRDRLRSQAAKIDEEIESLLGKPAAPKKVRRRRRKGAKSLRQSILDVLAQSPEPKTAAEIAQAVAEAGYKSRSKSLVSLVRQVCYRSDEIQTKERGKFAPARPASPPPRSREKKKPAPKPK